MRKLTIVALLLVLGLGLESQNLIELYKKGTVKLVPDNSYATENNWDVVFGSYNDTIYGKHMGNRKSLIITPDGSVAVNNAYRNFYTKFDSKGNFVKEFGITGKSGKPFKKILGINGVINDSTYYTGLNNMGDMYCMDFEGVHKKTLKLNYITKSIIALPNRKFAVVGWAIWAEKFRDFVAIVDYDTNKEQIIWEHFTDRCNDNNHCKLFNYSYSFASRGAISFNTMPYSRSTGISNPPQIACVGNKLIIAIAATSQLLTYDLNGKLLKTDAIEWTPRFISVEEQKQIQQKEIDRYKSLQSPIFAQWVSAEENQKAIDTIIKEMEADLDKIVDPIPIPIFSTVIKDSDDNLLFFDYPKEENMNKFSVWIYTDGGKFVCQSSFVCDEFNLEINNGKMVFHNGYIYALQKLKKSDGVPLRLVRFKLSTAN